MESADNSLHSPSGSFSLAPLDSPRVHPSATIAHTSSSHKNVRRQSGGQGQGQGQGQGHPVLDTRSCSTDNGGEGEDVLLSEGVNNDDDDDDDDDDDADNDDSSLTYARSLGNTPTNQPITANYVATLFLHVTSPSLLSLSSFHYMSI